MTHEPNPITFFTSIMRLKHLITSAAVLTGLSLASSSCSPQPESASITTVEENFMSPPDSVRIAVYWYWLNDNLSPEGAVKDLQAMKKPESPALKSA